MRLYTRGQSSAGVGERMAAHRLVLRVRTGAPTPPAGGRRERVATCLQDHGSATPSSGRLAVLPGSPAGRLRPLGVGGPGDEEGLGGAL